MKLLAAGRDCDIYEYKPGLILRRSRLGRSQETEARTMEYARAHGYPTPAVEEVRADGTELVMERVDGPNLLDALSRRPWRLRSMAALLARLHHRLHAIPGPDWLPQSPDGGDRVIHLDLHPLNVLLSDRGPMVIDWPNAARGDPATDVANTWMLLACAQVDGSVAERLIAVGGRRLFLRTFLGHFDRAAAGARLPLVEQWRTLDRNMRTAELEAMARLAARHAPDPAS